MPPFAHKQPPKIQPATIGNAGVYYVCFELSLRGLIAMPTVRNTAGIDVLVSTRYDQILGMGRGEEGQAALLLVVSMIPSMKRLPASTWGMS